MKKKNPVRGFPIILNKHAVTVIHVFTRHDCIEDVWMSDCFHHIIKAQHDCTEATKQMIEQLSDWWTPTFLIALRESITKKLQEPPECRASADKKGYADPVGFLDTIAAKLKDLRNENVKLKGTVSIKQDRVNDLECVLRYTLRQLEKAINGNKMDGDWISAEMNGRECLYA